MTAPDPLTAYYSTEYHRRNMQVARVCGAKAAVDQALERALTVKSIPVWLIAYLESAANRLPGISGDLAAWRDVAPDAPEHVRRATPDPLSDPRVKALVEALESAQSSIVTFIGVHGYPIDSGAGDVLREVNAALRAIKEGGE